MKSRSAGDAAVGRVSVAPTGVLAAETLLPRAPPGGSEAGGSVSVGRAAAGRVALPASGGDAGADRAESVIDEEAGSVPRGAPRGVAGATAGDSAGGCAALAGASLRHGDPTLPASRGVAGIAAALAGSRRRGCAGEAMLLIEAGSPTPGEPGDAGELPLPPPRVANSLDSSEAAAAAAAAPMMSGTA